MSPESNFIDELLLEAEAKELMLTKAHYDLVLLEISRLQQQITDNFNEVELEVKIINNWALQKNSQMQDRISFYEKKLEAFIREEGLKTIELPNGILKLHKKPDKAEVTDVEVFLTHAKQELVKLIPEQVKPDLNKIKAYIKLHRVIPNGVTVIEGREEFSYKLNNQMKEENNGNKTETGTTDQSADEYRAVI